MPIHANLIADANGDLFGTTAGGGANSERRFVEIARGPAPADGMLGAELVRFNGTNGADPIASLIADANGDLFGTTEGGGANGFGAVFEIAKTAGGYASMPTTLVSFNVTNGAGPSGSLIADANGDLFGTTGGGRANGAGTVFEIAGGRATSWQKGRQASIWDMNGKAWSAAGIKLPLLGRDWKEIGRAISWRRLFDILWQNTSSGQASIWQMNGNSLIGGGAVSPNLGRTGAPPGWAISTATAFPTSCRQKTTTGQASIWEMNGNTLTGGGPVSLNPGPAWKAVEAGDFTGYGHSDDILWQNTSTGQVSIWEMNGNSL